jgi:hypothetical protein
MSVGAFFFTDMDPRLQIQGSRDGLGSQAVWATVGRQLVGNLTLSSNDMAGFRTLLIAYAIAGDEADNTERLRLFLRWEQAAAACRVVAGDSRPPLGARRVRRRLAERSAMTISSATEHQIFGDQRSSGLWVLYQRAARDSGLVDRGRRVTPTGRRLAERWLEMLPSSIVTKVRKRGPQPIKFGSVGKPIIEATEVARLLVQGDGEDAAILQQTLVDGVVPDGTGGTVRLADGRQERLAALLAHQVGGTWRARLSALQNAAEAGGDHDLAERLIEVQVAESVLHPAQAAFDDLLVDGNGASPDDFAMRLTTEWRHVPGSVRAREFRDAIEPLLRRSVGVMRASLWTEAGEDMAAGEWKQRGGAAWVRMGNNGTYDVRLPLGAPLPEEAEILDGWRNPYYLYPLWSIQRDLVTKDRL